MRITEKTISIKGLNINYAESGEGSPMIFLTNGGGFWQCWYYQVKYFAKFYKVFAIDWPGCGESQTTNIPITLEYLLSFFEEFVTKLKLSKIILVGNCIGSSVALSYNVKHKENVTKLVLMNVCPGDRILPNQISRKIIIGINKIPFLKRLSGEIIRLLILKTPIRRKFPNMLFGKINDDSTFLFQKLKEKVKEKKQAKARINLLCSLYTYNVTNILNKKVAPNHLLIWGAENQVASLENHGLYNYKKLESPVFKIIPNGGHLCMYEYPEIINKYILNHINKSK